MAPLQHRYCYLVVAAQWPAYESLRSYWLLDGRRVRKFELTEEGAQRRFGLNDRLEDWQIIVRAMCAYANRANPPELVSFLVHVRKLDKRRENFFDNPRALILVICKDLQDVQPDFNSQFIWQGLTFRINDNASSLNPRMALLPSVLNTTFCFFPLASPSIPDSTTKNGPIAIYTVCMMIASDITTVSAQTRLVIRGITAVSAWKISLSCRRCSRTPGAEFLCKYCRRGDEWPPTSDDASTNG